MLVHRDMAICDRKTSMLSWSSPEPFTGKMVTVSNRHNGPSTWQLKPPSWKGSPPQLLFFNMFRWHMATSAECWPNTTLNVLACCLGRPPVSFILWRTTWKRGWGGVYSIPCKCGEMYIGETVQSILTRKKGHHWHIWLGHPDKLAVAEYKFNHNHVIKFQDTWILSTVPGNMEQLTREAVQSELYPNNMNREDGLTINGSWKPLLRFLRDTRWPPQ